MQITVRFPVAFANRPVPPSIVTTAVRAELAGPDSVKFPVTWSPLAATIVTRPLLLMIPSELVLWPVRLSVYFPNWLLTPDSLPERLLSPVLMLTDPVLRPLTGLGRETVVEALSLPLAGVASLLSPVLMLTDPVLRPLTGLGRETVVEALSLPLAGVASLLSPVTRAVSLGLGAVAERLVPRSIAAEPAPSVEELAVPFCTCDSSLVDTLALLPCEPDGLANAGHGVAARLAPMPSATANAPTRPI